MKLKLLTLATLILVSLVYTTNLGCGANAWMDLSTKDSDDALYADALIAMDKQDWDTAITKFGKVTGTLASNRQFINDRAAAYAGKCGLDFITYFTNLASFNFTGSTIFKELLKSVRTTTVHASYCATAESLIMSIGQTASLRSSDENLFMLILSMFKIGAYLKTYLDPAGAGQVTGINVCSNAAAALPSAAMKEIATGWSHFMNNFSAFSGFPAAVQTAVGLFQTQLCSVFVVAGTSGDPCKIYDSSNTNNGMTTTEFEEAVNTVRDMLKTGPTSTLMTIGVQEAADTPCDPPIPVDAGTATTFRACCAFAAGNP